MSDQKTPSAGDPVDEPNSVEDVVGRANEGLAEAEAAQRDAAPGDDEVVVEETVIAASGTDADGAPVEETVVVESVEPTDRAATPADDEVPWYDRPDSVPLDPIDEPVSSAAPATEPEPEPVHPVAEPAYSAPQPIFVQAPEAPRPLGNRGAAGAIGLLAALAFAVLFFAVIFGFGFLLGSVDAASAAEYATAIVVAPIFWVPVVAFYLAFWLLGAILNRGRWAHWVIWGLLVGVASYGGYLLGVLFQAPFWTLTAREGRELLEAQLFFPSAILAFVLGRELTIWFGAWVSARGRRITELNEQAQREYERTLEAGPQLLRP
ncbi:ABC transporter [Microbacterium sp. 18062]|uniref:ABC transporter n=1 Tax=Microbacterium sp. 18062 TaxID=2681410 RepID=UPI001359A17F|nr:ABC transporter [Microbacterium sp. 18062]